MDDDQPPDEFALITALSQDPPSAEGVRLGIGDDAAILTPPSGPLIAAADQLVEGVHFDLSYTPLRDVGYKALAVNLSDLAAMGARPLWALVTVGLPRAIGARGMGALYDGLFELARSAGCAIVGGDTTASDKLMISITALGTTDDIAPVTRKGASPGDALCVCGRLGGARAGLDRLMAGHAPGPWATPLLRPQARLAEGAWLARHLRPTAMIDVSDGLLSDLGHLLRKGRLSGEASLGARLRTENIPLSPELDDLTPERALAYGLNGGEDYALLFTLPPERLPGGGAALTHQIHVIGEIIAEPGLRWHPPTPPDLESCAPWHHFGEGRR